MSRLSGRQIAAATAASEATKARVLEILDLFAEAFRTKGLAAHADTIADASFTIRELTIPDDIARSL